MDTNCHLSSYCGYRRLCFGVESSPYCMFLAHYWFLNLTFKSQSQKEKWSEYVRTCCCQANGNVKNISVQRILIDSKWWYKSMVSFKTESWWIKPLICKMNKVVPDGKLTCLGSHIQCLPWLNARYFSSTPYIHKII